MALTCPCCDCYDVEIIDSNGAKYPDTRIEVFECRDCGHEFREVLVA